MYVFTYLCVYIYLHICVCTHIIYIYIFVCIHIYTHICVCTYIYIYIFVCVHTHIFTYLCVYIHVYIYIFVCVCVCVSRSPFLWDKSALAGCFESLVLFFFFCKTAIQFSRVTVSFYIHTSNV